MNRHYDSTITKFSPNRTISSDFKISLSYLKTRHGTEMTTYDSSDISSDTSESTEVRFSTRNAHLLDVTLVASSQDLEESSITPVSVP